MSETQQFLPPTQPDDGDITTCITYRTMDEHGDEHALPAGPGVRCRPGPSNSGPLLYRSTDPLDIDTSQPRQIQMTSLPENHNNNAVEDEDPPTSSILDCSASLTTMTKRLVIQRYLRLFQLGLYTAIGCLALIVCVTVSVTFNELGEQCPLYAQPGSKVGVERGRNGTHYIHIDRIKFGQQKTCFYCLYLNAVASTYSLTWGILFALVTSDKYAKKSYLRKTIFPSLLFNAVMFTSETISSCVLSHGFASWCSKLVATVHIPKNIKLNGEPVFTCSVLQSLRWQTSDHFVTYFRGNRMFALLVFAQLASWLLTFCTLILTIICAERFFKSIWHGDLDFSESSQYFQSYPGNDTNNYNINGRPSNGHIIHSSHNQQLMSTIEGSRQRHPVVFAGSGYTTDNPYANVDITVATCQTQTTEVMTSPLKTNIISSSSATKIATTESEKYYVDSKRPGSFAGLSNSDLLDSMLLMSRSAPSTSQQQLESSKNNNIVKSNSSEANSAVPINSNADSSFPYLDEGHLTTSSSLVKGNLIPLATCDSVTLNENMELISSV